MPKRISLSEMPRTGLTGFPKLTAGGGAAAKAGAVGAAAAGAGAGGGGGRLGVGGRALGAARAGGGGGSVRDGGAGVWPPRNPAVRSPPGCGHRQRCDRTVARG